MLIIIVLFRTFLFNICTDLWNVEDAFCLTILYLYQRNKLWNQRKRKSYKTKRRKNIIKYMKWIFSFELCVGQTCGRYNGLFAIMPWEEETNGCGSRCTTDSSTSPSAPRLCKTERRREREWERAINLTPVPLCVSRQQLSGHDNKKCCKGKRWRESDSN